MADKKPSSSTKVDNIAINVHSGRELIATWGWTYPHTKEYQYTWEYDLGTQTSTTQTGDSRLGTVTETLTTWILASSGTTDTRHLNSLYTPPDNAVKVRFSVKPVSTTYKKDKKDTNYWTVGYTRKTKNVKQKTRLETPSAPNLEIEGYKATISVNYNSSAGVDSIQFFLVNDTKSIAQGYNAKISYGKTSVIVSVLPNQTYRAYCFALAPKGSKDYEDSDASDYSSEVDSPPETPTLSSVSSESETSVKLTLKAATNADTYEVQYVENQEHFDSADSVNSKSVEVVKRSTRSVILTGMETGKIWYFRMRGTNDAGSSFWSNILSCALGEAPNAPSIWSSSYTGVINESVILYWTHNSLDGSKMTTSELFLTIYHQDNNGTLVPMEKTITVQNDSTDETTTFSWTFDPNLYINQSYPVVKLIWKARTKGVINTYSPYSITNTIEFRIKPEIALSFARKNKWYWDELDLINGNIFETKGDLEDFYEGDPFTLERFPLYVVATVLPVHNNNPIDAFFAIYAEESYQTLDYIGENVRVMKGDEVYSYTTSVPNLDNNVYMLWIMPNDVVLENDITYRFYARIVIDNGMVAEVEKYFTVDFEDVPYVMNAETTYDEDDVSMYIRPYVETEEGDLEDVMFMSVYRQNFDGKFVPIMEEIPNDGSTTIVDPHPTLRYVKYRLSALTLEGQLIFTDFPAVPVPETAIVIQWDETWNEFTISDENPFSEPVQKLAQLKLPFNVDTSESNSKDSELVEYIGRRHPVSYYGTQVGQKISLSCDIVATDTETIDLLRRLSVWMGDAYVREPTGHGYWSNVEVSFSKTHLAMHIPVKIEVTRVEGGI